MLFQTTVETAWEAISDSLTEVRSTDSTIITKRPLRGGSINSAYCIETGAGDLLFVKLNSQDLLPMFEAEADGLRELCKAEAIRVPEPICHGAGKGYAWLVTEYIRFGQGNAQTQKMLGRQLARLHRYQSDRSASERFGWHRDNTIGSTLQINDWSDDWVDFYRKYRLGFQLQLAADNGFTGSLQSKGERLMASMDCFFTGHTTFPSLMHGDLWGGNQAADEKGAPVIFDPAVYYGDREADLAMTTLFGGFSGRFYEAYEEAWPLDEGWSVRKTLYNLYHVLNHANLFGGGYAMQAESMMDQLLAEC